MRNEYIVYPKRVSVYTQGKRAFEEHRDRGYNPYAASHLALAISWWYGWDTAEEESKDEVTQPRQSDTLVRMHVPSLSKKKMKRERDA